ASATTIRAVWIRSRAFRNACAATKRRPARCAAPCGASMPCWAGRSVDKSMTAYVLTGRACERSRARHEGGARQAARAQAHKGETMRRHLTASAACLLGMLTLCGCLMEGTIDKSGGGTLKVRQRLASKDQFEQAKKRLQSADVTVTDASISDDVWATFQVKFT